MDLADLREEYALKRLRREDLQANPFDQFALWMEEAERAELLEPNAMSLATVDGEGKPCVRTVLLKALDEGLVFYTNYESRKAQQMAGEKEVAVVFPWLALQRQVSVMGVVEKVSRAMSEAYFQSRPYSSQLGAWVSQQSAPIEGRQVLEDCWAEMAERFPEGEVPLPEFWGGYRIVPLSFEFWQGRRSRLHDRFIYERESVSASSWQLTRLSP